MDFYRPFLTSLISRGATPYLVDLTAWGALSKKCNFNRFHCSADSLDGKKLKTLKASDMFSALMSIRQEDAVFSVIEKIIQRQELRQISANFPLQGMTIGEAFQGDCPVLQSINSLDCALSYSLLQYLEILFFIEMVLQKPASETKTIKFILPNNESDYYPKSLADDVSDFLQARGNKIATLSLQILCFKYGSKTEHRPYSAPSKTIPGKKKLNFNDIVFADQLNPICTPRLI